MPERDGNSKRESRRTVLKKTGYSVATGGVTLSGLTSVAHADPPDNDGPKVGTEVVVTSPPGAGDDEWGDFITEYVYQVSYNLPTYGNPGGLALEACRSDNNTEACLSAPAEVYYSRKDCGGILTPKLYWTTVAISETYDSIFQVEVSFWIGINPDTMCLWVGQEDAGVCTELGCNMDERRNNLDGDPYQFVVPNIDWRDWIQGNPDIATRYGASNAMSSAGSTVAVAAGAGIVFSIITGINDSYT